MNFSRLLCPVCRGIELHKGYQCISCGTFRDMPHMPSGPQPSNAKTARQNGAIAATGKAAWNRRTQ